MDDKQTRESAEIFCEGFFSFWNDKLKNKELMQRIITYCFAAQTVEGLHEASFTAKYIVGLHRVFIDAQKNPEVKDTSTIEADLAKNLQKVSEQLTMLLKESPEDLRSELTSMLQLTQESFERFYSLLVDLDYLKQYINLLMRELEKESD
jgi:hypothetical protein